MSSATERVAIYIDGGNFYRRLREAGLPSGVRFDHSAFVESLLRGRALTSKRYYIGIVRNHDHTEKSQRMVEAQQKFLSGLSGEGFTIKRGRIVYDHGVREKGVDVKIALDLVVGAVDDLYDTAIIISSDTDLIPAIKYVRFRKRIVEHVGFSHAPSLGMIREATSSVLLLPDDLQKFLEERPDAAADPG